MRILFDVRYADFQSRRGIGIYVRNLLGALAQDARIGLDLMADREHAEDLNLQVMTLDAVRGKPDDYYDIFCMPSYFPDRWADRIDRLEIILPYEVIRTCRSIVGIGHDLIPLIFPDIYLKNNATLKSISELGLSIASAISRHTFAISQSTANDFINLGGLSPSTVTVVGGGVDKDVWADRSFSAPRTNHVVYVGGDDPRKNLDGAVKGFAEFKKRIGPNSSDLIIVGGYSTSTQSRTLALAALVGLRVGKDLRFSGVLGQDDLVALVQGARASIFPSFYEGLGLPILESYAAGTPVAASNSSSMRELVPPECQFDPRDPHSIGQTIYSLFADESVRQASLAFGQLALERFTWRKAATKMVDTLARIHVPPRRPARRSRIAVFSCMPPDRSGIATNSCRVFKDASKFDIFTDISSREERLTRVASAELTARQPVNVFPASTFPDVHESSSFAGCLYVLGNSHHNLPALDAAIRSRGMNINRSIYLHDGRLENLWFWHCGRNLQYLLQLFANSYISGPRFDDCRDFSEMSSLGYFGIRPLALLTGIRNFIVNSERAKSVIERELAPDLAARIDVAYLSIDRISSGGDVPFRRTPDELIIGHFGIPHIIKGTPKVLAAAADLAKTMKVRVLLAGWDAKAYLEHNVSPIDRDKIILVDSPSDEHLFRCMKWVDVAVQLRERHFGESSGIVSQLIGVGKKPIVSCNLIGESIRDKTIAVPNDVGVRQLASVIAGAVGHGNHDYDLTKLSSDNLGALISQLVLAKQERSV